MACRASRRVATRSIVSWLANATGAVRGPGVDGRRPHLERDRRRSSRPSTDIPAVAASGSRAAVAWTDGYERHRSHLDRRRLVRSQGDRCAPAGATYTDTYGPALALNGDDRHRRGVDRLRHGLHDMDIGHPGQPCLERIDRTMVLLGLPVRSSGPRARHRLAGTTTTRPSSGLRPRDGHVIWNAGTAGTNSYRIVMRTGLGVVDAIDVQRGPDDAAVRRARQRGTAANTASFDGRVLTDRRPAGIESACRPAGAFIRGPGLLRGSPARASCVGRPHHRDAEPPPRTRGSPPPAPGPAHVDRWTAARHGRTPGSAARRAAAASQRFGNSRLKTSCAGAIAEVPRRGRCRDGPSTRTSLLARRDRPTKVVGDGIVELAHRCRAAAAHGSETARERAPGERGSLGRRRPPTSAARRRHARHRARSLARSRARNE